MVFDVSGCRFGIGVIPGRADVALAVNDDIVIAGNAFPGANGAAGVWLKIFLSDAVGWEIMVAFNDFGLIAFGDNDAIPDCFGHVVISFWGGGMCLGFVFFGCSGDRWEVGWEIGAQNANEGFVSLKAVGAQVQVALDVGHEHGGFLMTGDEFGVFVQQIKGFFTAVHALMGVFKHVHEMFDMFFT